MRVLGWVEVSWAASGEHPRVLVSWGSTAPQLVQLQGSAGNMVRCHLESRALPLLEGAGGPQGSKEVSEVRVWSCKGPSISISLLCSQGLWQH